MRRIKVNKLNKVLKSTLLSEYEKNILLNEIQSLKTRKKKKIRYKYLVQDLINLSVLCGINFNLGSKITINKILKLIVEEE